jgi:hypothetical protein
VALVPPNLTAVAPLRLEPVTVTDVPPAVGPELGEILVTLGSVLIVNGGGAVVGVAVGFSATCGRAVGMGATIAGAPVVAWGSVRGAGAGGVVGVAAASVTGAEVAMRGCGAEGATGAAVAGAVWTGVEAARVRSAVPVPATTISVARRSAVSQRHAPRCDCKDAITPPSPATILAWLPLA